MSSRKIILYCLIAAFFCALFGGCDMFGNGEKEQRKKELEAQRKKQMEAIEAEREFYRKQSQPRKPWPETTPAARRPRSSGGGAHRAQVKKICEKHDCRLVKYEEKGGSSYIEVEGPTHSSVSAILDDLIRAGMKDFTEHKDKFGVRREGAKRVYHAAYTVKW